MKIMTNMITTLPKDLLASIMIKYVDYLIPLRCVSKTMLDITTQYGYTRTLLL